MQPLPVSHCPQGLWGGDWGSAPPCCLPPAGRFPPGPGRGSEQRRGCAWLSPQRGAWSHQDLLQTITSFPRHLPKKKERQQQKKKRTKNPTIIKDKKKTNKKTSRLFPLPPHFPALCFPAPTHLSSLLEDCPQLAPAGLCSAPWGRLGSILLGLNPLGLILLGAGGLAWCVRGAEGTPSVGQCGDRACMGYKIGTLQNRDGSYTVGSCTV